MLFHSLSITGIEKKVPDNKLIGTIIKLKKLCWVSQVYEIKPMTDPILPKITDVIDK